jgi:hypothetical protein
MLVSGVSTAVFRIKDASAAIGGRFIQNTNDFAGSLLALSDCAVKGWQIAIDRRLLVQGRSL